MSQRKTYSKEFKEQTAKMVIGGSRPADVARELGVAASSVVKWTREYRENGVDAFPGKGRLLPWEEEKRRLERELRRVTIQRDILKKTIGFLSEES